MMKSARDFWLILSNAVTDMNPPPAKDAFGDMEFPPPAVAGVSSHLGYGASFRVTFTSFLWTKGLIHLEHLSHMTPSQVGLMIHSRLRASNLVMDASQHTVSTWWCAISVHVCPCWEAVEPGNHSLVGRVGRG